MGCSQPGAGPAPRTTARPLRGPFIARATSSPLQSLSQSLTPLHLTRLLQNGLLQTGAWWEAGAPLALAHRSTGVGGRGSRENISVTNERAIESSIVSMGSRWGGRGIPAAWPGLRGVGGWEGDSERERGVREPCGVRRWGREGILAVTHRGTQVRDADPATAASRR